MSLSMHLGHERIRFLTSSIFEDNPLENKLRYLYALQLIDNNLDELEELKGDLPAEARMYDAKVAEIQARLAALEHTMKSAFAQRDTVDGEIIATREKLEKYRAQQMHVRNNKEYDALTREMDHATDSISRMEKEMQVLEGKASIARDDIERVKVELEEASNILEEKRVALAEISKTTEAEETKYTHEREKLVVRIEKGDLRIYERIRKAKKGKAVVPVRRGACGGCFNKVPPQKLLELRQNAKLFTCEHCGRILVSDEIAETAASMV